MSTIEDEIELNEIKEESSKEIMDEGGIEQEEESQGNPGIEQLSVLIQ